jgi:tetrahydromethanopterin S-methyltransferase subunit G
MTVMVLEVYDALRSAGVLDANARRAAEAMARDDRFERLEHLIEKGFARIDERFAKIDERFAKIDERFARMDDRFTRLDERLAGLDSRMSRVEARAEYQGKMLGFVLGILGAVLSGTILLLVRVFLGGVN